MSIIISK